jgi:beta-glucanase (GH16 family)
MTKNLHISALWACAMLLLGACKQSDPPIKEYVLVWADEFNSNELDLKKWEVQLGDGRDYGLWRWGNNEAQYYRRENVTVSEGILKIKSVREDIMGYEFSSARIRTLNKGDFKYGKIEASIKMDNTGGLWHAFWMLPSFPARGWPYSGEIDILEYVGNLSDRVLNYIHFADEAGNHRSLGTETFITQDDDFHKYSIEWDENQIIWFMDDKETYRVVRTAEAIKNTWPFNAEFHLILNTAVGGNLGRTIDYQGMQTPRFMMVDYVRVYQRN